jgi:hypothetical protein
VIKCSVFLLFLLLLVVDACINKVKTNKEKRWFLEKTDVIITLEK